MNNQSPKRRRTIQDTINDAITSGAFTREEFEAGREKARRELDAEAAAYQAAQQQASSDDARQAA